MLKITKNQLQSGQKFSIDKELVAVRVSIKGAWEQIKLKPTTQVTTRGKVGSNRQVPFTDGKDNYWSYWQEFKSSASLNDGEQLIADKPEYVIFLDGKKYKAKKYSDIGKIKAALLVMMNYHGKFYDISQKFLDNCPEHQDLMVSEWLANGDNLTREDFKNIEIFEWSNRKLGKKIDFNAVGFYDEQMLLIKISAQFGSSSRDLFKKVKDTHKYIFVFMHESYGTANTSYIDFQSLKESDIIKTTMSELKFKNTYKSTKNGKTAIAFDNATDVIKLSTSFSPYETGYKTFIIDMSGNELIRKEESLVIQDMRDEKLSKLFA